MASEAFNVFTVDAPRTFRTIRKQIQDRRTSLMADLVEAQDWVGHVRIVASMDELSCVLSMLDEIEGQER